MKFASPTILAVLILTVAPANTNPSDPTSTKNSESVSTPFEGRYFELALEAATRVKDDAFRADGLRAEVARTALLAGNLAMAGKALAAMSPTDYRLPLLTAEWLLRGGEPPPGENSRLTLDGAWNLAITLAPRRRAEALAAMRAGFPSLAERRLPDGKPLASGAIAAEVAEFRFTCLALFQQGKLPGATEWDKALAMIKNERFTVDPEGLLLTDCLIEMGFELLQRGHHDGMGELVAAIESTLSGSKVPSLPQGIEFCRLLIAAGEREKALPLLEGLSKTVARISPRNPLRADFESRLVLMELALGNSAVAKQRATGLTAHLEAQMDYEQFIHGGAVIAAMLGAGEAENARVCLQRLVDLAGKNENPNNLRFLQGNVALALAQAARVTKVSQSAPAGFDTLLGRL